MICSVPTRIGRKQHGPSSTGAFASYYTWHQYAKAELSDYLKITELPGTEAKTRDMSGTHPYLLWRTDRVKYGRVRIA